MSEVLWAHRPQPAPVLLAPRQGVLVAIGLVALSIVLLRLVASGPALAVWATALLIIPCALPCLLSVATAVGITGVGLLLMRLWSANLSIDIVETLGVALIGALAFGAGHALARLHRLRMKIAVRNARLTLNATLLEHLAEQHSDGIALLDGEGRVLAHNARYRALLGADHSLIGTRWRDRTLDQARTLQDLLRHALQNGSARAQVRWPAQHCVVDLRLIDAEAPGALLVCSLRAQKNPLSSDAFAPLITLAEARDEGLIVCDAQWRIVALSDKSRRWTERSGANTPRNAAIWTVFTPFTPSWCSAIAARLTSAGAECHEHFDGESDRWYEVTVLPWREGFAVSYRNISATRQAAARIAGNAARWKLLQTAFGFGEWRFDPEHSEFLLCATARQLLGLAPDCERISKQKLLELVAEPDRLKLVQGIIALTSARAAPLDLEIRLSDRAAPARRLRWLGGFAEDEPVTPLFGTIQAPG